MRVADNVSSSTEHKQGQGKKRHEAPALINLAALAKILGISRTKAYKMKAAGQLPKPIKLGQSIRWGMHEIQLWIDHKCPPGDKWEKIQISLK